MKEADEIADANARKASSKAKECYDQRANSSVLQPGDRVLVRNLLKFFGPGKLRSHWEDKIHVIVRCLSEDIPVYQVCPANGGGRIVLYIVIYSFLVTIYCHKNLHHQLLQSRIVKQLLNT